MNRLIKIISVCGASLIFSGAVSVSAKADRPAIWSGFYAGGSIGGAFSDFDKLEDGLDERVAEGTDVFPYGTEVFEGKKELDVLTGGIHIGYNHQSGKLVLGIEAGVDFLDAGISGTETENYDDGRFSYTEVDDFSAKISYLASLRGRIGFASEKTLIYGTAGVAWTTLKLKASENYIDSVGNTENGTFSMDEGLTGFVVGGGAEYMITKNVSLRGEVLHYKFNADINNDDVKLDTDFSTTVGKVGVSYKF